ncbi:MAG: tRNA (N(6)-L-threonylcarbamoyladenosine(37)-C(2))-methylthiotransferase MtaB [Salinivirgaceae bacterium]|nr:tRNA (N(6)-L-threonylcarbamoyladenosine(37)-C(2))-methylthiotransferase MtaB [Salinivirgaceae bacterium]MDY0279658.1 tRNA (N(6)-L-threonylcarbamoyladenosine(37)-C(2))-methylthiotransferase MtaB [Salinivirgaceae bacterium]
MTKNKSVALFTLGCKLNFSETSTIARKFLEAGYEKVDFNKKADVYVINTCSVTEVADKKCRNIIQKAIKQNSEAQIVVVGCYAQLKPEQIQNIDGVDIILSNRDKHKVVDFVEKKFVGSSICDYKDLDEFNSAWSIDDRTRSFLKIQDGCDYFCSYCTIPIARGLSRSDLIKNVIEEAKAIVSKGVKEIVLTGVNIGDFGRKQGESLYDLLVEMQNIEGLERLRISSIEPNLLENRIIDLAAKSSVLMPHFHIPLQCGTDKLLKLMRRRYTTSDFKARIRYIQKIIPQAFIAIDIIVGVPEESNDDFNKTISFLELLGLSELHIFTYSERPNTKALEMAQVPKTIRKQRSQILHQKGVELSTKFAHQFESTVRPVLFEKGNNKKSISGFTDNYLKVSVPFDEKLVNKIVNVKLNCFDVDNQTFIGEIAN